MFRAPGLLASPIATLAARAGRARVVVVALVAPVRAR